MLLVYTSAITPRLRYTFDLIFREILDITYAFTTNADQFSFHTGAKINYSEIPIGNELFFFATRFLFEKGIRDQQISVFDWEESKAFFATNPKHELPFDPFAASFYLVSRYEEYLPYQPDSHGRFPAKESLAYQKRFLSQPLVDIYAVKIRKLIREHYPDFYFPKKSYTYQSTFDIDNAYAYRQKGLIRTAGAYFRSFSHFEWKEISERTSVLLGLKKDPFDTYEIISGISDRFQLEPIYFFLLGDYGEFDRNISVSKKKFQSLIKAIADYHAVGIHPSYSSMEQPNRLKLEQSRLMKVVKKDITKSRQHFLKINFPLTYRNLVDCDITDDYTMGFAQEPGFRAGTCTAFYFYDLDNEQPLPLKVHPFAVMDATLNLYMKISPGEVMKYVEPLIRNVKAVDGTFITLWHNESLSGKKPWEGWENIYEEIVRSAVH